MSPTLLGCAQRVPELPRGRWLLRLQLRLAAGRGGAAAAPRPRPAASPGLSWQRLQRCPAPRLPHGPSPAHGRAGGRAAAGRDAQEDTHINPRRAALFGGNGKTPPPSSSSPSFSSLPLRLPASRSQHRTTLPLCPPLPRHLPHPRRQSHCAGGETEARVISPPPPFPPAAR